MIPLPGSTDEKFDIITTFTKSIGDPAVDGILRISGSIGTEETGTRISEWSHQSREITTEQIIGGMSAIGFIALQNKIQTQG